MFESPKMSAFLRIDKILSGKPKDRAIRMDREILLGAMREHVLAVQVVERLRAQLNKAKSDIKEMEEIAKELGLDMRKEMECQEENSANAADPATESKAASDATTSTESDLSTAE